MKILSLRGENLASLQQPFTIDFDGRILGEAGLFAITGNTGAGKSTLLDAICLALFDRMPRLQSNRKNDAQIGRDDDSNRIAANDVRNILSRGAAEGFAEVDFLAEDGQRYRAHWTVRRARGRVDGRLQQSEMWLENLADGVRFAGKKTEVLVRIEQLLGLSFEQFQRAVLLPQGEFAAFLKANADERAALLERMTGGEIYSRLSQAAYERARSEEQALSQLSAQLGDLQLLPDEEQVALQQQSEQLHRRLAAHEQQMETVRAQQQILQRDSELLAAVASGEAHLQTLQARLQSWEGRRQALQDVERVQSARLPLNRLMEARLQHQRSEDKFTQQQALVAESERLLTDIRQQADLAEQAWQKAEQSWTQIEPKLKQGALLEQQIDSVQRRQQEKQRELRQQQDALQSELQARESLSRLITERKRALTDVEVLLQPLHALAPIAPQFKPLQEMLEQYRRTQQQLTEWRVQEQELIQRQPYQEAALSAQQRQIDSLNTQLQQLGEAPDEHSRSQAYLEQQSLQQQQALILSQLERVQRLAARSDNWLHLSQLIARQQDDERRVSARLEEARQQIAAQEINRIQLRAQHGEAEQALRQMLATAQLDEFRPLLKPEQPCPLCGSLTHPYREHAPQLHSLLSRQQQRLRELEAALRQSETEIQALQHWLQQAAQEQPLRQRQLNQWLEQLHACERDIAPLCVELGLEEIWQTLSVEQDAASWQRQLQQTALHWQKQAQQAELHSERLHIEQRRYEQVQQQRLQLSHQLATERQALARLEQEQLQQREQLTHLQAQLQREQLQQTERAESLDRQFGPAPVGTLRWREWIGQSYAGQHLQMLAQQVAQYQKLTEELARVQLQLHEHEPKLAELQARIAEKQARWQAEQDQVQQLQQEQVTLQQQRRALLGDMPLARLEEQARTARQSAELRRRQTQNQLQASQQKISAEQAALATLDEQHQQNAAQLRQVLADWMHCQQALELNEQTLLHLLSFDEAWLRHERAELQTLEQELQQASTRLQERQQQRQALAQQVAQASDSLQQLAQTHQLTVETLLTGLQQQLELLRNQEFELKSRLRQADEARQRAGDLRDAIAQQQQRTEQWLQLSDLIGSATGNKFRTFAQGLTLEQLLLAANEHLNALVPRYALMRVPGSTLALQVVDHDMGDEVRAVESLSGGETFLISLALALALASLCADTRRLGSLFIDEGFGTLDPDSLEQALACLDALQADGRQIGVISHVSTLVERIGTRIAVESLGGGRSRIRVLNQ